MSDENDRLWMQVRMVFDGVRKRNPKVDWDNLKTALEIEFDGEPPKDAVGIAKAILEQYESGHLAEFVVQPPKTRPKRARIESLALRRIMKEKKKKKTD